MEANVTAPLLKQAARGCPILSSISFSVVQLIYLSILKGAFFNHFFNGFSEIGIAL